MQSLERAVAVPVLALEGDIDSYDKIPLSVLLLQNEIWIVLQNRYFLPL